MTLAGVPSEVVALLAVVVLSAVQVGLASVSMLRSAGPEWVLSARDKPHEVPGVGGRLVRAHRNLLEVLPQFVAVLLAVHMAESVSSLTVWGAWAFFFARVAYIPAYISDIPWLRPACWQAAFVSLLVIAADVFV